jgi:nucleotide-binding universal stress UspA family protein
MIALKKVLVATDFEPASESALRYGRALARSFGAELHVLHVVENLLAHAVDMYGYAADAPGVQRDLERKARERTEALLDDDDRRELRAVAVTNTSNGTAEAILDYARENSIDLIVMGSHGRGGVAHFFMGSVAERVVRMALCPVLTVRHPEHDFVFPDALIAVDRKPSSTPSR